MKYYIRFRGRRRGPLTLESLQAMARRGRFGRHYEVSTDGRNWESAADYPELFEAEDDPQDGYDDFDDSGGLAGLGPSDPIDDMDVPLIDPGPGAGGRRDAGGNRGSGGGRAGRGGRRPRGGSRAAGEPADDQGGFDQEPPRRSRRRRSGRDAEEPQAPHLGYDDIPAEQPPAPRRRAGGSRAARRRKEQDKEYWQHTPDRTTDGVPDSLPLADEPPARSGRSSRNDDWEPPSNSDQPETRRRPTHDESDEPEPPKKRRKFLGLFGRGDADAADEMPPYLATLKNLSERLPPQKFDLGRMLLIGSNREELPVLGRDDSGDGIQTLGWLTMLAYQSRATDIHLEPKDDGYDARVRVDGMLVPVVHLPKSVAARVAGVVKVLCEIDFAGTQAIQEGSYSALAPGRRTDYRVSFTPSVHGQKLAIRVLDLSNTPQSLDQLGASQGLIGRLRAVMQQNAGMILMCGPTGSGKTTTLYSLIRGINVQQRNVMTLEDPVEYQIAGVTQSSVKDKHGRSFADMLRALLRQDPDVLLLGEIRDAETARVAMQATMTGHLVLSTVHAPDTLNTIFRLLDLGADPNMVASALDLVLAQRLVRVLCRHCRIRRRPTQDEVRRLGRANRDMIYDPRGCGSCLNTGFFGRRAIFELLATNDALRDVMLRSPTLQQLRQTVQRSGFVSLRQYGNHLVAGGHTAFSEVDRVLGIE